VLHIVLNKLTRARVCLTFIFLLLQCNNQGGSCDVGCQEGRQEAKKTKAATKAAKSKGTQTVNAYYAKFVELCNAVQADIASAFVVRKFLRNLNPLLHSNLIIHFGGRVEVEGEDLGNIHRVAQQSVAQQSKTVLAKTVSAKTVTDRQQLQCSYCQIRGHNVTTCYKKRNADSRQTTTNSNTNTSNTSHNNYSKFNNSSNNYSNHTTITRPNTSTTTNSATSNTYRDYKCFSCGKTGHRSRDCPNRK
jgi:hypothetical protein